MQIDKLPTFCMHPYNARIHTQQPEYCCTYLGTQWSILKVMKVERRAAANGLMLKQIPCVTKYAMNAITHA